VYVLPSLLSLVWMFVCCAAVCGVLAAAQALFQLSRRPHGHGRAWQGLPILLAVVGGLVRVVFSVSVVGVIGNNSGLLEERVVEMPEGVDTMLGWIVDLVRGAGNIIPWPHEGVIRCYSTYMAVLALAWAASAMLLLALAVVDVFGILAVARGVAGRKGRALACSTLGLLEGGTWMFVQLVVCTLSRAPAATYRAMLSARTTFSACDSQATDTIGAMWVSLVACVGTLCCAGVLAGAVTWRAPEGAALVARLLKWRRVPEPSSIAGMGALAMLLGVWVDEADRAFGVHGVGHRAVTYSKAFGARAWGRAFPPPPGLVFSYEIVGILRSSARVTAATLMFVPGGVILAKGIEYAQVSPFFPVGGDLGIVQMERQAVRSRHQRQRPRVPNPTTIYE